MADTNVVVLTGRLGRDPEVRYTANGTAVCKSSVAVNVGWGDKKKTHWITFQAWGKTAEFIGQYITKGCKVTLTGRLETNVWEKDGKKNYETLVVVNEIENHTRQEDGQGGGGNYAGGGSDDIPF